MTSLLVLNGPNLNLLGTRQPDVYGSVTLADIEKLCVAHGAAAGVAITFAQSNNEGAMVEMIHAAKDVHAGIAINAGAYTHTSVALHDAIASVELPAVELHLSNVHAREEFRHKSMLSPVVIGSIAGFGARSYTLAIDALIDHLGVR